MKNYYSVFTCFVLSDGFCFKRPLTKALNPGQGEIYKPIYRGSYYKITDSSSCAAPTQPESNVASSSELRLPFRGGICKLNPDSEGKEDAFMNLIHCMNS